MLTFQSKPTLVWKTGHGSLRVLDREDGRTFLLIGFEAALWGWLTQGYPFSKVKEYAAAHLETDQLTAASSVLHTLNHLNEQGILIKVQVDDEGHGVS